MVDELRVLAGQDEKALQRIRQAVVHTGPELLRPKGPVGAKLSVVVKQAHFHHTAAWANVALPLQVLGDLLADRVF